MTSSNSRSPSSKSLFLLCVFLLSLALSGCEAALPAFQTPTAAPATLTVSSSPPETPTLVADTPTPSPTATPTRALNVQPQELKGIRVQFWHPWSGPSGESIQSLAREFSASNPWEIAVDANYRGNLDELAASVEAAFSNEAPPDLIPVYLYQAQTWDSQARLVDLTGYVNDPEWGLAAGDQADFYPPFWEHDVVQGKRLGVPALRSGMLLYYNLSWAQELGFTSPPTNPQDFQSQACAANAAYRADGSTSNDAIGGWAFSTQYPSMLGWLGAFGAQVTRSGQAGYQFNTPEVAAAFAYLKGLYDQKCAFVPNNTYAEADFATRRALFISGSITGIPIQQDALRRSASADQWTVLPFPSPGGRPAVPVYGPSYSVIRTTPASQLAAWLFVRWLLQPENEARFASASSSFPLRQATLDLLADYRRQNSQWAAAVDLLEAAQPEPQLPSWQIVRWSLSDAARQIYRFYFPELPELLENTANELDQGEWISAGQAVMNTPTSTGTRRTPTPTRTPKPTMTPPPATATP